MEPIASYLRVNGGVRWPDQSRWPTPWNPPRRHETPTNVKQPNETLSRRTAALAASNRQLQRGIARHQVKEVAFQKSGRQHDQCLQESLRLQKQLRQLTHQALAAQEDERKSISLELQNEIAQTLLGINVRLLSLKLEARNHGAGLNNKIAKMQELLGKSAAALRQFAHELDTRSPTQYHDPDKITLLGTGTKVLPFVD
jgi:signal transduction histidine kinase